MSTKCKYIDVCDYTQMCDVCEEYKFYYKSKHYKNSKKDFSKMKGTSKSKNWNKKEKEFADNLDAKQTMLSGSINGDGDAKNQDIVIEVKHTNKDYIMLLSSHIKQMEREKGYRYGLLGLSNNEFSLIMFEYDKNMNVDIDGEIQMNKQKKLNRQFLKSICYEKKVFLINILSLNKKYVIICQNNFYDKGGIEWIGKI